MSLWVDRLRRRTDGGMGLIEVIVSMVIFGIAVAAVTPLLIGGLQASRTAQLNTKARALGQERLEKMRNLPFHVAVQNKYVDVLDIYFTDVYGVTGPPALAEPCDSRSYAAGVYSCLIKSKLAAPYTGFSQLVQTRFLDENRNLVMPAAGYNSQSPGNDMPASNLLGVDITTSWVSGGKTHSYKLHSSIVNAVSATQSLEASLKVAPLNIVSNMATGDVAQLQAGLLSMAGDVATGSDATLSAVTAMAGLGSGQTISGARETRSAPGDQPLLNPSDSNAHSLDASCSTLCFGQTAISNDDTVRIPAGDPMISAAASQVVVALRRTGSNIYHGFSFSNADSTTGLDPTLQLLQGPMVSAGSGSTSNVVVSQGYLDSSGTGTTSTVEQGSFSMPILQLFPTSFAPNGLVQIVVSSASLTCKSGGGTSSVTAAWQAEVLWTDSAGSQHEYDLAPGKPALPDPATLVVDPNTGTTLSHWISSWSGLTSTTGISKGGAGVRAVGNVPPIVSIITAPTRITTSTQTQDPTSALSIAVGAMSCVAQDIR